MVTSQELPKSKEISGMKRLVNDLKAEAEIEKEYDTPINPETYSFLIGQGFSTNWFKQKVPMAKYNKQNIIDVYNAGFRNLRLRRRADLYPYPYDTKNFTSFLDDLQKVVNHCLKYGVMPIISWIHHDAEANETEVDRENYITWWKKVADKLKGKDYRLSFNLFTELGVDVCRTYNNCNESLGEDTDKYNTWTSEVVAAIRGTGRKNKKRILIIGSPKKTARGLELIDKSIYENDNYMMVEWHTYSSGPNKKVDSIKHWIGNGSDSDREQLLAQIKIAQEGIPLYDYFGAWMPINNLDGALIQTEVENFARYFVSVLKEKAIPWSLNVLDRYYDTKSSSWVTGLQNISGQSLDVACVLDVIKVNMK